MTTGQDRRRLRPVDRDILRLAVPALGALMAEPLFLLADSAMIGHLGVVPLAGLGVASAVLQTVIGLMVFLAYATTPRSPGASGTATSAARCRSGWTASGCRSDSAS